MSATLTAPDQVPVQLIDSDDKLGPVFEKMATWVAAALDTETVILRDEEGNPLPRNLSVDAEGEGPGPCRVISLAGREADDTVSCFVLDMGYITPALIKQHLEKHRFFMWNANFDRLVLRRLGIFVSAWDMMLGEAIERTGAGAGDARSYTSLAKATKKWLGFEIEGKQTVRTDYRPVEERPVLSTEEVQYAGMDTVSTLMVARVIGARLAEAGLTDTFVRDCNGQPFIHGMESAGLPFDPGYKAVVDAERFAMNTAAERVALATTGREMLETLFAWGRHTARVDVEAFATDVALGLLHDTASFTQFLTDIAQARSATRERIGAILGVAPVEDLFAEVDEATTDGAPTFLPLPFDPSNDVEVRRWFTKQAPHFAASLAIASREEVTAAELFATDAAAVMERAGRKKALTKDTEVDEVITAARAGVADVTEQVAAVALELAAFRRYNRILADYAGAGDIEESGSAEQDKKFLVPTWDLASAPQVKDMFNRFYPELVRAYMARVAGEERLFEKADSVDGDALKLIGGELAEALLEWRKRSKIVSTYGDELLNHTNPVTGRVHARYNQSLTGTGRLSSFKPNAQNLSPLAKPYIKPPLVNGVVKRVLVCADLSQAEQRFVADAAQDIEMLTAFRNGEDLHERTASLMFNIDLKTLKSHGHTPVTELVGKVEGIEPFAAAEAAKVEAAAAEGEQYLPLGADKQYKLLRNKAKAVAFGYNYGLKGLSLSRQLTVQGVPTTKEEADELLKAFDRAYPQLAAWMQTRVDYIAALADAMRSSGRPSGVDFAATWMLHNTHAKSHQAFNALVKTLGRNPSDEELANKLKPALVEMAKQLEADANATGEAAVSTDDIAARSDQLFAERARVAALARWALNYDHAVVLRPDGSPWEFESRTAGGRRRRFQVSTKHLMMAVVIAVSRARRDDYLALRDAWVVSWNSRKEAEFAAAKEAGKARGVPKLVSLTRKDGGNLDGREIEKVFEDTVARDDMIAFILSQLPAGQMEKLWRVAMADRIRQKSNEYRNHPIQGGVADAVMVAYADIHNDLTTRFPTARGIQSVHDSIVVECDIEDAEEVCKVVVARMEGALAAFCPTVPCKADGDIQLSLDDSTKLDEAELARLISLAAAA